MNPDPQIPQASPDSGCGVSPQNVIQPSGCGILPQSVQGASRSESALPAPQPPARSNAPHIHDDMGFVYPPETCAEPAYADDYDYEDDARERELLMDDLADYNEDFSRSNDEGWFYSDEN